jgi:hypothetical protein
MSANLCFDYLIGYSRKEDLCVSEDWDDLYAVSESGLYVDELPGMPQRFIDSLGGNYDIWEKMANAKENAINAFKIDVISEIYKYKEPSRQRFYGDIGRKSFTTKLTHYDTRGLRMYSDIIGGSYALFGVSFILDITGAVDFSILDENYDVIYSTLLLAQAGRVKYNLLPTPITLPLNGNYYFLYDSTTSLPYNNELTCHCGGWKWCFNMEHPCFGKSRDKWTEWAMVAGVYSNTNTDLDDWPTTDDAQGMVLHGDFSCDIIGTLCTEHSNWLGNEIDYAIANAIWYKTGEFLATYVMDSEEVSRKTLLGVEQWNVNRTFYNERYVAMINFIAENFEAERNECLKCKPPMGYKKMHQML